MTPPPQTRRPTGDCGFLLDDLPADPVSAHDFRRDCAGWLAEHIATSDERRDDIVLAVYEAVANATEHAYDDNDPAPTVRVHTHYRHAARTLNVTISDHGTWKPPQPAGTRGRGITLIKALSDTTEITTTTTGTTIALRWTLAPSAGTTVC